jgi:hypothetical protein
MDALKNNLTGRANQQHSCIIAQSAKRRWPRNSGRPTKDPHTRPAINTLERLHAELVENVFQRKPAPDLDSGVDTGSREENAPKQESEPPFRFNLNRKGSSLPAVSYTPRQA